MHKEHNGKKIGDDCHKWGEAKKGFIKFGGLSS